MHVDSNRTKQDWTSELWPDDGADPDWPDDWPESGRPDVAHRPQGHGVPAEGVGLGRRVRSGIALGLTAAVALGAGAGAVYLYKSESAGSASAATSPSPGAAIGGRQAPGGGPGNLPGSGGATKAGVMTLGQVLAVGHDSITLGGPGQQMSARTTSATQFTGTARSLAQVRVGDIVAAEITVSGGVATLVRLQDPASQP
jgi:hypothetical protein